MFEIKVRGYKFLIEMGRITIEDVPVDYRTAVEKSLDQVVDQ